MSSVPAAAMVVLVVGVAAVAFGVLFAVREGLRARSAGPAPSLPRPAPRARGWDEATVAEVTGLLNQGLKIHAIKVIREATGCGLREAKDRAERWSDVVELHAVTSGSARAPGGPAIGSGTGAATGPATGPATVGDERLRIEASAIVATSGWHTAEAFLREQRGLTPEAARAVLDSVS